MATKPNLDHPAKCRVDYHLPENWFLPGDFDIASYPGLLTCQIMANRTTLAQLRTEWASLDLFTTHSQKPFEQAMRLDPPLFVGRMMISYAVEHPWWKSWQSFYGVLITLVAIGTNLETLGNIVGTLSASPDVTITLTEMPSVVVAGENATISYTVHNNSRAQSTIRLRFNQEELGSHVNLLNPGGQLALPPDETKLFTLKLQARSAGQFSLRCSSEIRAGKLRMTGRPPALTNQLAIWATLQQTNVFEKVENITEKSATYVANWRHGAPNGSKVTYQAILSDALDCRFLKVDHGTIIYNMPSGDSPTILWEAPPKPGKVDSFSLYVGSTLPHEEAFWKNLKIQLIADEN